MPEREAPDRYGSGRAKPTDPKAAASQLRRHFDRWEAAVFRFGTSVWSTVALALFGLAWIGCEAARGKTIGWDGAVTLILGEIALATLRKMKD